MTHRYDLVLHRTAVQGTPQPACERDPELKDSCALDAFKHGLQRDAKELPEKERTVLDQALHSSKVLSTIYSMRQELTSLRSRATASRSKW